MYRLLEVRTVVADDSNLSNKMFEREAVIWKTADLESVAPTLRVAPGASQAAVSLGTVSTGKFVAIYSSYPIKVRFNASDGTQLSMNSANVPATNNGAAKLPMCFMGGNFDVTAIYVEPLSNATDTADVWICVTGDASNNYTVP